MAINEISYPHPVYGNRNDIVGEPLSPKLQYMITEEAITLTATELDINQETIKQLILDGSAAWQIRVQCPRTYIRLNYSTNQNKWEHSILGPDLEGSVKIEINIIAKVNVNDYCPAGMHEDYGNETFDIKSGELLAIGPQFSIHVDKEFDPLKAPVSSIIKVEEGDQMSGPFLLALDDDIIYVKLSKIDWSQYAAVRDRVPTMLHTSIVLPVLIESIRNIEKYKGTLWAGRLNDIIHERDLDISKPIIVAQEILSNPIQRAFAEVNTILDGKIFK